MSNILVDTGVWISLCDPRDGIVDRDTIEGIYDRLRIHDLLMPWPIAYECLRTRFVRNKQALGRFEKELRSTRLTTIDDAPYRDGALSTTIESSLRRDRPLSFVDCLIRSVLDDRNLKIDFLVTFNIGDFQDVCRSNRIEIWSK